MHGMASLVRVRFRRFVEQIIIRPSRTTRALWKTSTLD